MSPNRNGGRRAPGAKIGRQREDPFMSTHREIPFRCTYESGGRRETTVVAAWDPETAEVLFREMLSDVGPSTVTSGVIEVASTLGRVVRHSAVTPTVRATQVR
jgi:hypothetical protein